MKRVFWSATAAMVLATLVWAATTLAKAPADLPALFSDGALLYLQAKDFRGLLKDWNSSEEKRAWIKGDNYQAFSRSRLFGRLSQAQDEFSAAASIPTDNDLLSSVAGSQSALALYDVGNLEFVYATRMDQSQIEATPLWHVREKFEQRTEGAAQFFVHEDSQSHRTAVFAAREGWLILGSRAELIAGVLDRLQGAHTHSLPDDGWYADVIKLAAGPADDLRMVLNLEKLVPSPYFRSYWIQHNITEMKQYRCALSDLHRSSLTYREDRVLLRKPGLSATTSEDVQSLLALAPDDAVFASAKASPDPDFVLAELRDNILDLKPARAQSTWSAPQASAGENAGSAAMLEERIDIAPVIVSHTDPYQPLRTLLAATQPAALLEVYATRAVRETMFVTIDRGLVIQAAQPWNEADVQGAMVAALRPNLTASQLGIKWIHRSNTAGDFSELDGQVQLYLAARGNQIFVANNEALLQRLLSPRQQTPRPSPAGVTYTAVFHHATEEQQAFRKIVNRLDSSGRTNTSAPKSDADAEVSDGQNPSFFSGNIVSLSQMFKHVMRETVQERDQGAQVMQTVEYQWQHQ
jgi:hypothetical protein